MGKTSIRFPIWMLAPVVVMGVAAGCGGTPGPVGDPVTIVTHAPDASQGAGSAQVVVAGPNAGATGTVDLATGDADYLVRVAPGRETANLRTGELRSAGGTVWFRPTTASGQPTGPWLRLPAGTPVGLGSTGLHFGDPLADIDLIRGTQHILSDGGGEVRGVSTARYTIDIDPAQAIGATAASRRPALQALLGGRTDIFQIDVWIDGQDRVRRVQVPIDLTHKTPVTRPDFLPIADTVDFSTFGPPHPQTAPG